MLENAVSKTVIDVLGGKGPNAYRQISKKVFAECSRDNSHNHGMIEYCIFDLHLGYSCGIIYFKHIFFMQKDHILHARGIRPVMKDISEQLPEGMLKSGLQKIHALIPLRKYGRDFQDGDSCGRQEEDT